MKNNTKNCIALLLCSTFAGLACAGRPLAVDDANVNETGHGQLEAWIAHAPGSTVHNLAPAYAPIDGLEIGVLLARERHTSLKASAVQAKWLFTPSQENGCNFGAVLGLAHTQGETNRAILNGLLTCNREALGSVHLNLGVTRPRRESKELGWGVAVEKAFSALTAHLEWFGAEHSKPTIQAGLRTNLTTNLQLDGSLGRSDGRTSYTLGTKLSF